MNGIVHLPTLYLELADWWPILSAPEDYAEEAAFYRQTILDAGSYTPQTLLELGSGGGNNASHLKAHFDMTLVDLSPGMLVVSQRLNPECEHIQGDMRTVRLGRQFDAVFIHDAIAYLTSEFDLRQAIETAFLHCRPGGVALFAPDHTRENYRPSTDHGGHDGHGRSLRYLEWNLDPDPGESTHLTYMVYLLREGSGEVQTILDKHLFGLFSHEQWMTFIADAGFQPKSLPFEHSEVDNGSSVVFLGCRPTS